MSQFRGLNAYASSYSWDGCGGTSFYIGANQSTSHAAGGSQYSSDDAYVYYYVFNWCTGTFSSGGGYGQNVSVSGNQSKVTVSGAFSGYDVSKGGPIDIVLNLTFVAAGSFSRGETTSQFSYPYASGHTRSVGTYAEATASGSATVNGVDLMASASTYGYGQISSSNSGSVTLVR